MKKVTKKINKATITKHSIGHHNTTMWSIGEFVMFDAGITIGMGEDESFHP